MHMDNDNLFCVCRTRYDERLFMIECDGCKDWFHGKCVGISEQEADSIEEYHCGSCQNKYGPTKLKSSGSKVSFKPEEFELIEHASIKKFYQALDDSMFLESSHIVTYIAAGISLTNEFIYDHAFEKPIVIGKPDGLGLVVPPITSSQHLESYLGSNHAINMHDIMENEERMIKLAEWSNHFDDDESLDNISIVDRIDITGSTKLFRMIKTPKFCKSFDLVENCWPKSDANEDFLFERPKTSLFISMGDTASFTDFQIGMSGGSIWYYNITGSRTFYLVPPTEENLKIFEDRGKINNLDNRFFGDLADACYKLLTRENETVIIPGGWIFASYINKKSISIIGEFCDIFNIKTHILCYEIQKRLKSLNTIKFPHFEVLVWCAAETIHTLLSSNTFKYSKSGLVDSAKDVIAILRKWISKKEEHLHAQQIPPHINPTKLINSISYSIGKINRVNNQRISPLKIRTKPGSSKQSQYAQKLTSHDDESSEDDYLHSTKGEKISIKFNKSLLFTGQNNSAEANTSPAPIKLRLPKTVLKEVSPKSELSILQDDTVQTTKSGRKRKRPKNLSGFVDPSNKNTALYHSEDDEISKTAKILSTCEVEKPEISKIRQRLHKSASKISNCPSSSVTSPATTPIISASRKSRNIYNEDSPDEFESESFLSRCKQDSFYIYPTIGGKSEPSSEQDEDFNMDTTPIKLKVKLPINKRAESPASENKTFNSNKVRSSVTSRNKKGFSTPKQRLGKLLKIDKSFIHR